MKDGEIASLDRVAALHDELKGRGGKDVHATYSQLIAEGGICPGKVSADLLGGIAGINEHDASRQVFSVLDYAGVARVLTEADTFTCQAYVESLGRVMEPNVLMMDGVEHRRQRALLNPIFSNTRLQVWNESIVKPVITEFLDTIGATGANEADLSKLCVKYPFTILSDLLGLPRDNIEQFHILASEILGAGGMDAMFAASTQLGKDIRAEIANRKAEPGIDLVSALVAAEAKGDRFDDDEIVSFLKLLFSAGAETTSRGSANLLAALLTHPDQLAAVKADRRLITQAIEEALRWESPVGEGARMAMKDTEINGTAVPAGSIVYFYEGAANRDPAVFERPDEFNIFRSAGRRHLAFGHMRHLCLGQGLSRMEITSLMNLVLDRFPNIRLNPDMPPPVVDGVGFRSPLAIHVLLN